MNDRTDEGPRNAALLLGLLMTPVASLFLLWAYAHATMVDPALDDSQWFTAVISNLFRAPRGWLVAASGACVIFGAASVFRYFMNARIGPKWVGLLLFLATAWVTCLLLA